MNESEGRAMDALRKIKVYVDSAVLGDAQLTEDYVMDNTAYRPTKSGAQVSNLYERLNIKVRGKDLSIAPGSVVELLNPVGVVYGERNNQLSISAEDVRVVQPQTSKA